MKYPILLLVCCFIFACYDKGANAQSGTAAETITGKVDPGVALRQGKEVPGQGGYTTFRMGSAEAAPGQRVCLPVATEGFTELVGFQYTMRFDSAALRFESIRAFNLNGYNHNGFGTRFADRGYVSTLWTDMTLQGVSLPEGHQLFEICFTNLMPAGERATVRFQDGPTAFEVVNKHSQRLRFAHADGEVLSKE